MFSAGNSLLSSPNIILCSVVYAAILCVAIHLLKTSTRNSTGSAIIAFLVCIAAAFTIRVVLAAMIPGHPSDISCFKAWAQTAAQYGLSAFYSKSTFADYPPGYIYILYLIGKMRIILSLGFDSPIYLVVLKMPAILCDILTAIILFLLARRRFNAVQAWLLSSVYLFNPAIITNSAIYGQVDSIFTLAAFGSLLCLYRRSIVLSSTLFIVALLIKPTALIFVAPVVAFAFVQAAINKQFKLLLYSVLAMAFAFTVIVLPFSHDGFGWIFKLYSSTIASYPYASVNAFNLFALLGGNGVDQTKTLFLFSYQVWGIIFTAVMVVCGAYFYFRMQSASKIFMISLLMIAGTFVLSARMHERYIYPALLLAVAAYIYYADYRLLLIFAGFSFTAFLNQAILLHNIYSHNQFWFSSTDTLARSVSLINVILLAFLIVTMIKLRTVCTSALPHAQPVPEKEAAISVKQIYTEIPPLTRLDYLIVSFLTVLYAVVVLFNLGSLRAPQSFWKSSTAGQYCVVDFNTPHTLEHATYFSGLTKSTYQLEFSDDANNWSKPVNTHAAALYDALQWRILQLKVAARYVRITAHESGAILNEIAFFESSVGSTPIKARCISGSSDASILLLEEDPENAFDEQSTAPNLPSFLNGMYFDETYHARTAYEFIHGLPPTETTHPPLGKIFISLGVRAFGMTPFGWRISGALFGIAMIPLMYMLAFTLFRKTEYALVAALLMCCDFMNFTMARIATVDIYAVFFIVLMFYALFRFYFADPLKTGLKRSMQWLFLAGLSCALGIACKWIAVFAAAGAAVIIFAALFRDIQQYYRTKNLATSTKNTNAVRQNALKFYPRYITGILVWCVICFMLIPVVVYVLSYIPYLTAAGPAIDQIVSYQSHMYNYHSTISATHPFASQWWQWPSIYKPVWAYMGQGLPEGKMSSIVIMGNPAIWWLGTIALAMSIVAAVIRKNVTLWLIIIAAASVYLPWIVVQRKLLFIYHFFATVPFLILSIVYFIKTAREKYRGFAYVQYAYVSVAILLLVMFYPILSGMTVHKSYVANWLRWFSSWYFYS